MSTEECKKSKRDPRVSTLQWAKAFYSPKNKLEDVVVQFEKSSRHVVAEHSPSSSHDTDHTANSTFEKDPINIICFDGGGLKGYAHIFMVEEILKRGDGENFCEYFNLAGGTSAGGFASLFLSTENGSSQALIREGYRAFGSFREFPDISFLRLLFHGHATNFGIHTLKRLYGDTPLYYPSSEMKAFALATLRVDDEGDGRNKERQESKFEPYLMRSYDMDIEKQEEKNQTRPEKSDEVLQLPGTTNLKLCEALAASSAAPVAFKRVGLDVDGERLRFGDGGIISNAPVAIAINEARCLWPDRPIGTIVSFGLSHIEAEDILNTRAIEACKEAFPTTVHYLRLSPEIEEFKSSEIRAEKIEELRESVRKLIQETKSKEVDEMLTKLVASSKPIQCDKSRSNMLRPSRTSIMMNMFHRKSSEVETKELMERISIMAADDRAGSVIYSKVERSALSPRLQSVIKAIFLFIGLITFNQNIWAPAIMSIIYKFKGEQLQPTTIFEETVFLAVFVLIILQFS